jgi:hypothetical protein
MALQGPLGSARSSKRGRPPEPIVKESAIPLRVDDSRPSGLHFLIDDARFAASKVLADREPVLDLFGSGERLCWRVPCHIPIARS